jgi:ribosome-associated protein
MENKVYFKTEYIKLQQFMKLANIVSQGSDAKIFITQGEVLVNGDIETRRGRKIYSGDIVEAFGNKLEAVREV